MTITELRDTVGQALATVPFVPPLGVDYCTKAMAALRERLPSARLEVNDVGGKHVLLCVEASVDGARDVVEVRVG